MSGLSTFNKGMSASAPYIAATGSGAAVGASVAEDRKKGAMKGALIGLGGMIGARASSSISNTILKKVFGNKAADAEIFKNLMMAGKQKEAIEFLSSKGYKGKDVGELIRIPLKSDLIRSGVGLGVSGATTAGTAYALKNDPNKKKQ